MVTKFEDYINEEFQFKSSDLRKYNKGDRWIGNNGHGAPRLKIGKITDPLFSKIRYLLHYPILKYIENKVDKLSDEEKLKYLAEFSRKLDLYFSPMNSLSFMGLFSGILSVLGLFKLLDVDWNVLYIYCVTSYMYSSLNKEYRLLAKNIYKKIRNEYTEKYLKDMELNDPLGEEQWEDNTLNKANDIRYKKKRNFLGDLEDFPMIGLHDKKDIRY
jgi:hypothetical protein